jgi:tetratricopeptide (TPR) repeat protein
VILLAAWSVSLFFVSRQLAPVALRLYEQAKSLHETAAAAYGDHHQHGLAASFEEIRRNAHLREAERLYKRAAELAARQSRSDLDAAAVQHQLGLLYRQQGRFAEAHSSFSEALRILRHLEYLQPDQSAVLAALSMNHFRLGELRHVQGDHAQARHHYQQSLALDQRLGDSSGIQQLLQLLNELEAECPTPAAAFTDQVPNVQS